MNTQATFFQKLTLTIIAAFFAACLVWFYKDIIQKGDEEINKNWRATTGLSTPR